MQTTHAHGLGKGSRWQILVALFWVLVLSVAACGTDVGEETVAPDPADDPADGDDADDAPADDAWEDVVAAAREEGQVRWDLTTNPEMARALEDAFNEEHPDIKLSIRRMLSSDIGPTEEQEIQSGQESFDVTSRLNEAQFDEWDELGRLVDLSAAGIPSFAALPDGWSDYHWFAIGMVGFFLAYNTEALGDRDVPDSWWALADPTFRGEIAAIDPTTGSAYTATAIKLWDNPEYGESFYEAYGANDPQIFTAVTESMQSLAAGQVTFVPFMPTAILDSAEGAPVDMVVTDHIPALTNKVGVYSGAENMNAALYLVEWLLSSEAAAELLVQNGFLPPFEGDLGQLDPRMEGVTLSHFDLITPEDYGPEELRRTLGDYLGF